jgi:integrase
MEAEQGFVVLRDQRKQTPLFCPYVFHRQGKPIKMFRRVWERALREAGCPEKLFHDFRRTAVRNMIRASIPESIAMEIAGFRTRSVFKRYHIMKETDLQEAAQKLARYQHEQHQAYAQVIPFPAR